MEVESQTAVHSRKQTIEIYSFQNPSYYYEGFVLKVNPVVDT